LIVGIGSLLVFGSGAVEAIGWLAGATPDEHHTVRVWMAIGFLITGVLVLSIFLWRLRPLAGVSKEEASKSLRAAVRSATNWPLTLLGWTPILVLVVLALWPAKGANPYDVGVFGLQLPDLTWIDSSAWITVAVLAPIFVALIFRSGRTAAGAVALVAVGVGWAVVDGQRPTVVPLAVWTTLLGPFVVVGYLMFRGRNDEAVRRGVGIIWDLALFWPRWFHPWAPPPYTEVAVPELLGTLADADPWVPKSEGFESGTKLIVSAHSQGAVIAFAAIRAVADPGGPRGPTRQPDWTRIGLLTYGNLIAAHYRELFPSFFTPEDVASVDDRLAGRWINLYRCTDPLGQPIPDLRGPAGMPPGEKCVDAPVEGKDRRVVDPGVPDAPLGH
jgi:hypothetical protein